MKSDDLGILRAKKKGMNIAFIRVMFNPMALCPKKVIWFSLKFIEDVERGPLTFVKVTVNFKMSGKYI